MPVYTYQPLLEITDHPLSQSLTKMLVRAEGRLRHPGFRKMEMSTLSERLATEVADLGQLGRGHGCDQCLELACVHSGIDDVLLRGIAASEYGGAGNCGRGCQSEKSLAKHEFIS